jgi:antitoxin HicB
MNFLLATYNRRTNYTLTQNTILKEARLAGLECNEVEMARRMKTSRAALDRLLDPAYSSVTLQRLCNAARAVRRDLRIELV